MNDTELLAEYAKELGLFSLNVEQLIRSHRRICNEAVSKSAETEEELYSSVNVLYLPARARTGLRDAGVFTLRDLLAKTAFELSQLPQMGIRSVEAIQEQLAKRRLRLKPRQRGEPNVRSKCKLTQVGESNHD